MDSPLQSICPTPFLWLACLIFQEPKYLVVIFIWRFTPLLTMFLFVVLFFAHLSIRASEESVTAY